MPSILLMLFVVLIGAAYSVGMGSFLFAALVLAWTVLLSHGAPLLPGTVGAAPWATGRKRVNTVIL